MQPKGFNVLREIEVDHARANPDRSREFVDAVDLVDFREHDEETRLHGDGTSGESSARTAGHDRSVVPSCDSNNRSNFLNRLRQHRSNHGASGYAGILGEHRQIDGVMPNSIRTKECNEFPNEIHEPRLHV
jgi:hypothetical protein